MSSMNPLTAKVLNALNRGSIRAIGRVVYDSSMDILIPLNDLAFVIREAGKLGIRIRRVDAGGSPTWEKIQ